MKAKLSVLMLLLTAASWLCLSGRDRAAFAAASAPATAPASAPACPASQAALPPGVLTAEEVFRVAGRKMPDSIMEEREGGYVDWACCRVVAVGVGHARGNSASDVAMARRAARLVAARNALLLLNGLQVGPGEMFPGIRQGHVSVDAVLDNFQELVGDYDPQTHLATVRLAWDFQPGACPLGRLMFLTRDGDAEVRRLAVVSLGKSHDPSAIDALREAAKDKEAAVRAAAEDALKEIGGRK